MAAKKKTTKRETLWAGITLNGPGAWPKTRLKAVAKWLRMHADELETIGPKAYTKGVFGARYYR